MVLGPATADSFPAPKIKTSLEYVTVISNDEDDDDDEKEQESERRKRIRKAKSFRVTIVRNFSSERP